MNSYAYLSLALGFLGIILIPFMVLMFRAAMKWTRVEDNLQNVADDLKQLVIDKDKTHQEMLTQMREDRRATDERLRWLERNVWNRNNAPPA